VQTTTFWFLSYLLFDRELYTATQEEIGPAFHDGVFDTNYIITNCPLLMSTYSEVLLLHISSNSVRIVDASTKFGNKILQPGNILMVPFAHMHRNSRAWGQNCAKFHPTRFLHTEKAKVTSNPSYRPFGAGGNSCPGKALAIRQVLSSVTYLMKTYDLRAPHIDGKQQSMPVALHSTPTIGTSVPKAGKDLVVELTLGVSEPIHYIIAVSP
jgi:cytochrome P450